jgi:hypothetical protein
LAKHALTLLDHFRQVGVTLQFSIIYLLLRAQNFIFGGSVMNSTIPADLLELEARFETWRTNRKYKDQAFAGRGKAYTEEARIAELERMVGRLTMENDLLKKALQRLNNKA